MFLRQLTICLVLSSSFSNSSAQSAHPYDIIIDEVFSDPSPPVALPNVEFLELKNVSGIAYDLSNWQIGNSRSLAVFKTSYILQPDSFVVICSTAAAEDYSRFGPTIGLSKLPNLNNEADTIWLQSPEGNIIHCVAYDNSWFGNDLKKQGGWSLEMIDTHNPCAGAENWIASTNPLGGSPGKINSVNGLNRDVQEPFLDRTFTVDSITIIAVFNESLSSETATNPKNYQFGSMGSPIEAIPNAPLFSSVTLRLPFAMNPRQVYQLMATNISDCAGNTIGNLNTALSGYPENIQAGDLIVNEILFNPPTNGYDYVELFNRSTKVMDLQKLFLKSRKSDGSFTDPIRVTNHPRLIFPEDYIVLTEDVHWVEQNYLVKYPERMLEVNSLPSLPDDQGDLVILNSSGDPVDELHYDHKWHFALISQEEGIALERIDPRIATQIPSNWTSAASSAGFGTPTYQNSEHQSSQTIVGGIQIEPKIFSPNNDGYQDFTFVNLHLPDPGFTANITIFDAAGRKVRSLADNVTLSVQASFRWDGLGDDQKKLPTGIYVVLTEMYTLNGTVVKYKNTVTLVNAGR